MSTGDTQSLFIQGASVILSPHKHANIRDSRQMRRIKAADRATTDNANSFHAQPARFDSFTNLLAWPISFFTMARLVSQFCSMNTA